MNPRLPFRSALLQVLRTAPMVVLVVASSASGLDIASVAGVYKHRFTNGRVQRATRRPIRYLKLQRNSPDYREALAEHGDPAATGSTPPARR